MNIGIFAVLFWSKISGVLSAVYTEDKENKIISHADESHKFMDDTGCAMFCDKKTKCKSFSFDSNSNNCRIHYKTLTDAENQGDVVQSLTIQHYHEAICEKTWTEWNNCTLNGSVWTRVRKTKIDEKKHFNSMKCYLEEEEETQNCAEINECDSNPCINNATCADLLLDYNCTCAPGWEGRNCQTDIDECLESNICLNSGICINEDGSFTCNCDDTGYEGNTCQISVLDRLTLSQSNCVGNLPRSCEELIEIWSQMPSNEYLIRVSDNRDDCPTSSTANTYSTVDTCCHPVYCDMVTYGKGWTVFQNRYDGNQEFHRSWSEYEHGFGPLTGQFWLGNSMLHFLTNREPMDLLVEMYMSDSDKHCWAHAIYNGFSVGNETEKYPLFVSARETRNLAFNGDTIDSLYMHNGSRFSTWDSDNDSDSGRNCAEVYRGGWWFQACLYTNLNGDYNSGGCHTDFGQYMVWWETKYSYAKTQMKFRSHRYSQSHSSSLGSRFCSVAARAQACTNPG